MTDSDLIPIFHGDSFLEAELIKGLLEAEGILSTIPGELATDHETAAQQVTGGETFDVLVAPKDAARARTIIQQAIEDGKRLKGYLAQHPGEDPGAGEDPD